MKFYMDIIMPPLKSSKRLSDTSLHNNNYMSLSNTNSEKSICKRNYVPKLLNNLNILRLNSSLCDVEIVVEGKIIKAHRAVLAASSPYFNAMFTGYLCEKDQRSVELHAISPHVLTILIDFIYSGEIEINQNNVQELMIAADMLELEDVVSGCSDYLLKEIHPVNAIGIYRFADLHNWKSLKSSALQYIQNYFVQITQEDEIYELPKDQIIKFLSSENLHVDSEVQVFQTAIRWITHDIVERRRYVFEVLNFVRLSLLPLGVVERTMHECNDSSLRVALKSICNDLFGKKGCLVPLNVFPRLGAKKHIFVIGGSKRELHNVLNKSVETSYFTIERFDTFKREWCKAPSMTVSRIVPGVSVLNGLIYVVGGEHESISLECGECYDPQKNYWAPIGSMIIPRCEFGLCAWNGYLYAVGGWVGGERGDIGDSIERYNPHSNSWTLVESILPQPRFSMGVVSFEGLIYIVGGCTEYQRFSQDLLSYNPLTGEWTTLPSMSVARSQMGVAILDDCLYVVGGTNKSEVVCSVERFSFKKKKWTMVPSMSMGRSGPAVVSVNGLLYVIGGYKTMEKPFYRAQFTIALVECFNPLTNIWSECPPLPESRAEAGAVVL